MAHESLAPGFIKLYYTQSGIQHVMTFSVAESGLASVGDEPSFSPKVGGSTLMSTFIDQFVSLYRPLHHTTTDINNAEYWRQLEPEDNPIWIYTHPIGLPGTNAVAVSLMSQVVCTFRTALGGIWKFYLMEASLLFTLNTVETWPFAASAYKTFVDYLISGASCVIARDNASLVIPIKRTTKINDALRKKRLLL